MNVEIGAEAALFPEKEYTKGIFIAVWLTLSPMAPCAPPCPMALGLIGPRKKEKKTGFNYVS
jgi:hypothetical protein